MTLQSKHHPQTYKNISTKLVSVKDRHLKRYLSCQSWPHYNCWCTLHSIQACSERLEVDID